MHLNCWAASSSKNSTAHARNIRLGGASTGAGPRILFLSRPFSQRLHLGSQTHLPLRPVSFTERVAFQLFEVLALLASVSRKRLLSRRIVSAVLSPILAPLNFKAAEIRYKRPSRIPLVSTPTAKRIRQNRRLGLSAMPSHLPMKGKPKVRLLAQSGTKAATDYNRSPLCTISLLVAPLLRSFAQSSSFSVRQLHCLARASASARVARMACMRSHKQMSRRYRDNVTRAACLH